jgi:hypothetical protein
MPLPATSCRACRHPQCKPVEGSDLCPFCEDHEPCPVVRGVQVRPAPLPPFFAKPIELPPVKVEPIESREEEVPAVDAAQAKAKQTKVCPGHRRKCGKPIGPRRTLCETCYQRWYYDNGQQKDHAPDLPNAARKSDVAPTNGHGPQLRPLDAAAWQARYAGRIQGIHSGLLAQIQAAPLDYRGEVEFPDTKALRAARHALERNSRASKEYRLHMRVNEQHPTVLGVLKQARS